MKWRKLNDYAIRSHCGCWQISRTYHGERQLFSLWRRESDSGAVTYIYTYHTGAVTYVYTYPSGGEALQRAVDEAARGAECES